VFVALLERKAAKCGAGSPRPPASVPRARPIPRRS